VVQWGFDETSLDGQACFNQWCMIRTGEGEYSIVTIECAGILPDSVAEETVEHIGKTWARGQVFQCHTAIMLYLSPFYTARVACDFNISRIAVVCLS
jgi:hypothetical protein